MADRLNNYYHKVKKGKIEINETKLRIHSTVQSLKSTQTKLEERKYIQTFFSYCGGGGGQISKCVSYPIPPKVLNSYHIITLAVE